MGGLLGYVNMAKLAAVQAQCASTGKEACTAALRETWARQALLLTPLTSLFRCSVSVPEQPPYELHEAARAGIRLMPDQGATIAGLRARVAELESRGRKLESTLRLEQQVKMLRRENARLREESSVPHQAQLKAEVTALRSENAFLKSHNLSIAAKLHAAEKALEAQGLDAGG